MKAFDCPKILPAAHTAEEAANFPQIGGWVNITKDFFNTCGELDLGELRQDVRFNFREAMSAIEMFDPKMDLGIEFKKKKQTKLETFESALEAGTLKLENLSIEELISIFDTLLACLATCLQGESVDQILLTCLYLQKPEKIKHQALKAYCKTLLNLLALMKHIIVSSSVNAEEDFQFHDNETLNLNLNIEETELVTIAAMLQAAEDEWKSLSKQTNDAEDMYAIVQRLRFMRYFYQAIYQFYCCINTATEEEPINEIYKNLAAALELLPTMKKTCAKGRQTQHVDSNADSNADPHADTKTNAAINPLGFTAIKSDSSQTQKKILSRAACFEFLEELLQHLKYACKIVRMREYIAATKFFIEFSHNYGNCILSRSLLQLLFLSKRRLVFGTIPIIDFLRDSVRSFNAPPVLDPKHAISADADLKYHVDNFFRYINTMDTFMQFIQICGFNRARQRANLEHFILTFDGVQVEAARLDAHLNILANEKSVAGNEAAATVFHQSAQFVTWVLYNCLRAMMLYLMLGFELELYGVHEFIYMYWYPYEILVGYTISALTWATNNIMAQDEIADQQDSQQSKQSKLHASNIKNRRKKSKKLQKPYREEITYHHALMSMCGGFYKAMGALTKDGRIRQPESKFDNEEIRFNHRFAAFGLSTSPLPGNYSEFKKTREEMMRPAVAEIYSLAARHFEQARNVLETLQNPDQEALDMLYVAKTNCVVMNLLAKGHQKNVRTEPEFDFSKHRHFPIIKL